MKRMNKQAEILTLLEKIQVRAEIRMRLLNESRKDAERIKELVENGVSQEIGTLLKTQEVEP